MTPTEIAAALSVPNDPATLAKIAALQVGFNNLGISDADLVNALLDNPATLAALRADTALPEAPIAGTPVTVEPTTGVVTSTPPGPPATGPVVTPVLGSTVPVTTPVGTPVTSVPATGWTGWVEKIFTDIARWVTAAEARIAELESLAGVAPTSTPVPVIAPAPAPVAPVTQPVVPVPNPLGAVPAPHVPGSAASADASSGAHFQS